MFFIKKVKLSKEAQNIQRAMPELFLNIELMAKSESPYDLKHQSWLIEDHSDAMVSVIKMTKGVYDDLRLDLMQKCTVKINDVDCVDWMEVYSRLLNN